MANHKRELEQIMKTKTPSHDYLMKVKNNEDGWKIIKEMRANAKKCGSSYRLVLRGSKPKTPWGNRPSIPLDEAQEIRIYIRPKQTKEYNSAYEGIVRRNLELRDKNYEQWVQIQNLKWEIKAMKEGIFDE